jgi:uncharacterized membrane protein
MHYGIVIALGCIAIILIDLLYLSLNKNFYKSILDSNTKIQFGYGLLVWIIIPIGIYILILTRPDVKSGTTSAKLGSILGFVTYGVYNFTNAAIYPSRWSTALIIGDTAWGTSLTSFISFLMYRLTKL